MKDLITTIGSITILMVFVLQFANNQAIATRILAADSLCDKYFAQSGEISEERTDAEDGQENLQSETQSQLPHLSKEQLSDRLADILNCKSSEISIDQDNNYVKAYIGNIIVCADFLGISTEENRAEYQYFTQGDS